jgi:hypothetical protein
MTITMTEYAIEIHYRKTIKVYGADTLKNRDKAREEFIRQVKESIDEEYADIIDVITETDYECEYKETALK